MKPIGIALVVLALVLAIVPFFTDCQSQGRALTLQNGRTIPMKCHWTGRAELALAIPLAGVGVLLALARRKETQRYLAIVGALAGAAAILLPTVIIGVCSSEEMICAYLMEPILILAGILTIVACAVALLRARGVEA